MPEYIDREALKAVFEEDGHLSAYVEEMIDSVPAADVRPVVRGEWIPDYDYAEYDFDGSTPLYEPRKFQDGWQCSLCGGYMTSKTNFCPNCGCAMETRARWVPNVPPRDLRPRCSACGELNPTEESICPNCGATMEDS